MRYDVSGRRLAFDTSHLIRHWHQKSGKKDAEVFSKADVEGWAGELIRLHETRFICTVVRVEFLCNTYGGTKLQRAREFLDCFHVVDEGELKRSDMEQAEKFAPARKNDRKPTRQLGDCLIAAVYRRLSYQMIPAVENDLDLIRRIKPIPGE